MGGIELGVVVLPQRVHFGQHRGGGAVLKIFLFTCALPGYFLQKKETGVEARDILVTHQLIYLFVYVFRCRESTGDSSSAMKQIGSKRHFQVSLTDFDRAACSFSILCQGSHSTDSLARTLIYYCLFVSGWFLSSGAIATWD